MQKKLIALAIAGLSSAAFAQSNVTVYGQVNMFLSNYSGVNVTPAAGAPNVSRIDSADSRLGFKGEEALGGGLKAVFTLEYGLNADSNGAAMSNTAGTTGLETNARQTFAGLSGGFGTITLGRQYTPFFEAAAAIDPSGASTTNVTSMATLHPIAAIARANNAVKYVGTFSTGGGTLVLAGLYGLGERATDFTTTTGCAAGSQLVGTICQTTAAGAPVNAAAVATVGNTIDPKVTNLKLAYVAGPLLAGVTWIKLDDNLAGIATADGSVTRATAFGGTYDFKSVKLHALYDRVTADTVAANNVVDRGDYMLGLTVPMGSNTFKVTYNRLNDKTVADMDGTHWGLSLVHAMSKRTNLVANYGHVTTSNAAGGAGYTLLGSSISAGVARKNGLQLGMAHSF